MFQILKQSILETIPDVLICKYILRLLSLVVQLSFWTFWSLYSPVFPDLFISFVKNGYFLSTNLKVKRKRFCTDPHRSSPIIGPLISIIPTALPSSFLKFYIFPTLCLLFTFWSLWLPICKIIESHYGFLFIYGTLWWQFH